MRELSSTKPNQPDHCHQCRKAIFEEKIILIDDPYSVSKLFCSMKCKWNYQVLMLRQKLEIENNGNEKKQSNVSF